MEFSTYTIEGNPDKTVKKGTNISLFLIVGALLTCVIGFFTIGTVLFILAVVVGVVLAIFKKGNVQAYVLTKNRLVITPASIEIAGVVYALEKIKDLRFVIHSYAGLDYMEVGLGYQTSDGMENYVSFTVDDKKTVCRFYLNSPKHTYLLAEVLQEFYYKKIPLIEIDRQGGQTYLLKRLNEDELAAFKKKYGY
jgi:hypothetical protein